MSIGIAVRDARVGMRDQTTERRGVMAYAGDAHPGRGLAARPVAGRGYGHRVPDMPQSLKGNAAVGRSRTRLTRRGRVVIAMMGVVFAWVGWSLVSPGIAESATGATEVTSYTVRPGDTLWSYASSVTPEGGDVSSTVNQLIRLNNLDSATLQPGQRIVVPSVD